MKKKKKIQIIDDWFSSFPCSKYWEGEGEDCVHGHITAEEMYEFIEKKVNEAYELIDTCKPYS